MKIYDSMQQHIETKRNEIGYSDNPEIICDKILEEAIELVEAVKRYLEAPTMVNLEKVKEEAGDNNILNNTIATILGFNLNEATINKLRKDKIRRTKDEQL